jgi:CRP-like cAMP-binding protein
VFIPRTKRPNEILYLEGEPADTMWLVRSGLVLLSRTTGGTDCPQAVRGGGELVGTEVLTGSTYLDTARALGPTTVCAAPRDAVDAWLGPASPARAVLEQLVRTRTSEPARVTGTAIARVASWLLGAGEPIPPIPRKTIASLLGLTAETMSRTLAALDSRGIVAVTRRSVRIHDRDALRALVD